MNHQQLPRCSRSTHRILPVRFFRLLAGLHDVHVYVLRDSVQFSLPRHALPANGGWQAYDGQFSCLYRTPLSAAAGKLVCCFALCVSSVMVLSEVFRIFCPPRMHRGPVLYPDETVK